MPVTVRKKPNSSTDTLRKKKLEGYIDYPNKYTPSAGKSSPTKKPDNPPQKFHHDHKFLSNHDRTQSHHNLRDITRKSWQHASPSAGLQESLLIASGNPNLNPNKSIQLNLEPTLTHSLQQIPSPKNKHDWCNLTVKGNGSFRVCRKGSLRDTVKTPSDIIISGSELERDSQSRSLRDEMISGLEPRIQDDPRPLAERVETDELGREFRVVEKKLKPQNCSYGKRVRGWAKGEEAGWVGSEGLRLLKKYKNGQSIKIVEEKKVEWRELVEKQRSKLKGGGDEIEI